MLQKLEQIQDILIKLLGRAEEFKGLALAVAPNVQLSDQAISILRQFIESGDDKFSRISGLMAGLPCSLATEPKYSLLSNGI